jgi:Uma2 family endonuclease
MSAAVHSSLVSYESYVAIEDLAPTKSEWINGVVYATAGGTMLHARLAASVIGILSRQLKGSPCAAYSSDLRIRSLFSNIATYPDVTIVCGTPEPHPLDANAFTNPTVIIEVLSTGTETFDRGDKAAHYRRMESVKAYVLISTSEQRIEVFGRGDDGKFVLSEAGPGQSVAISPIDCTLVVDEVYFEPSPSV